MESVRVLAFQALPPLQLTCHMLRSQGAKVLTVVSAKKPALDMLSKDFFCDKAEEIALDLKSENDRTYLLETLIP